MLQFLRLFFVVIIAGKAVRREVRVGCLYRFHKYLRIVEMGNRLANDDIAVERDEARTAFG